MYQEAIKAINREDKEAVDILVREIMKAIKAKSINCDRTYNTVIKDITSKGYVVLDRSGQERTVQCCIPGLSLRMMQMVWVKEPMGKIKDMYICGIAENKK